MNYMLGFEIVVFWFDCRSLPENKNGEADISKKPCVNWSSFANANEININESYERVSNKDIQRKY